MTSHEIDDCVIVIENLFSEANLTFRERVTLHGLLRDLAEQAKQVSEGQAKDA